jgi:hypothetical protein
MGHQGPEKPHWLKLVPVKLMFLFTRVMQLNSDKCMLEWALKKLDNYLKKQNKQLHPLFTSMKLTQSETEVVA